MGFWELLFLLVLIAALIIGVEKLPKLASNIGKAYGEFVKGRKIAEREVRELERKMKEENA